MYDDAIGRSITIRVQRGGRTLDLDVTRSTCPADQSVTDSRIREPGVSVPRASAAGVREAGEARCGEQSLSC
jgi:hypothetical protein